MKHDFKCKDCGRDVLKIGDWYLARSELWSGQLKLGWTGVEKGIVDACRNSGLNSRYAECRDWRARSRRTATNWFRRQLMQHRTRDLLRPTHPADQCLAELKMIAAAGRYRLAPWVLS